VIPLETFPLVEWH